MEGWVFESSWSGVQNTELWKSVIRVPSGRGCPDAFSLEVQGIEGSDSRLWSHLMVLVCKVRRCGRLGIPKYTKERGLSRFKTGMEDLRRYGGRFWRRSSTRLRKNGSWKKNLLGRVEERN